MSTVTVGVLLTLMVALQVVNANLFNDITNKVNRLVDTECRIPNDKLIERCENEPKDDFIESGTRCSFKEKSGNIQNYVCAHGFLVTMDHKYQGTRGEHLINKRFFGLIFSVIGVIAKVATIVGTICKFFCSGNSGSDGSSQQEVANKPPVITCPIVSDQIAAKFKNSVVVTWDEPSVTDPEDKGVKVSRSGDPSGSSFASGSHVISYTAVDDVGNKDVCEIRFHVTVVYCLDSLYIVNGKYDCGSSNRIYGTLCNVSCINGFRISSNENTTKECQLNGTVGVWSPENNITCEKKKCEKPSNPCNGQLTCSNDEYDYDTICYPTCRKGYDSDLTKSIMCNGDHWYGQVDPCVDVQTPEFKSCPQTIRSIADKENGRALISWQTPTAIDNSAGEESCGTGTAIIVQQSLGLPSGSYFQIGYHDIMYDATDSAGNTDQCRFTVIVEELSCEPLIMDDPYVLTSCPKGYSYGSVCTFSCFLSYELVGDMNVTCEKNSSNPTKAFWNWLNNTQTYCEKLKCPELPAPVGGALACSSALGNEICTMSCSDEYQVAKSTPIEYVCNDEQVWIQGIPPNCTDKVHPLFAYQPGDLFYYYNGDCNNLTVQEGIKEHFVVIMNRTTEEDGWVNLCPAYCDVADVTVICGALNGRRRRSVSKREATSQITVQFNIRSNWLADKDLWGNDEILQGLKEYIETKVTDGILDYEDVQTGHVEFQWVLYDCPMGLFAVFDTAGTCDGCPPGKYLDINDCFECDKGFYQDKEYQTQCISCPPGTSTANKGSKRVSECKETCPPGSFSSTGLIPCSPCPRGKYQNKTGSTTCEQCSTQTLTVSSGSDDERDCQSMDASFTKEDGFVQLALSENIENFTLGVFIKVHETSNQSLSVKLARFQIFIGQQIELLIGSHNYSIDVGTEKLLSNWNHFSITWIKLLHTAKFYVNGKEIAIYTFTAVTYSDMELPSGSILEIMPSTSGCSFTGFFLTTETVLENTINEMAQSCLPLPEGAYLSMDDVYKAYMVGVELTESTCDVKDECTNNPCGTGNICVNEQSGYKCKCLGGYSGPNCTVPPDFCAVNSCKNNATCLSRSSNFSCLCSANYTGPFCERKIEHGNWGSWLEWSECSLSCSGGEQSRERICNEPSADEYGMYCLGTNTSYRACNDFNCPECPDHIHIHSNKNLFNCSYAGESVSCIVTCEDGYAFVNNNYALASYECGPHTGFSWNSRPPACGRATSPRSIQVSASVSYSSNCSEKDQINTALLASINELQCVQNKTCSLRTEASGCNAIIQLDSQILETTLNLEQFYTNNIVSPGLLELVTAYTDLTMSILQLNTTDILNIYDDGNIYMADRSTMRFATSLLCTEGTVEQDLMCIECPQGTYWENEYCLLCSKGTYQNESAKMRCSDCPDGYTTLYVGSKYIHDCNVNVTTLNDQQDSEILSTVLPIAVCSAVLVILVLGISFAVCRRHLRKEKRMHSAQLKRKVSIVTVISVDMVHPVGSLSTLPPGKAPKQVSIQKIGTDKHHATTQSVPSTNGSQQPVDKANPTQKGMISSEESIKTQDRSTKADFSRSQNIGMISVENLD